MSLHFLLTILIVAFVICCSIVLNRNNLLPLRFLVLPLYVILVGVFFKFFFSSHPLEVRLGITLIFGIFSYIFAAFIFPCIFNFSLFQWFLYLFLRTENFRLQNKTNGVSWVCFAGWTIPLSTVCVILYFKLDPENYISFLLSLGTIYILLSRLIAFFMDPELEGFQFLGENQKLEEITWENFINSMSIVCMHYFKKPIKNAIGFSRSKFPLAYITKRPIFIKALTRVATALTDRTTGLITAGCSVIGAGTGAATLAYTVATDNQVKAAKIIAEAAQNTAASQERVAEINADALKYKVDSEERITQINADVLRYKIDKGSHSWWWFKKEGTPNPENTSIGETISKGISRIVDEI